ncbi:hypothetical protein GCM10020331_101590 [Ectobacillus funiculus]
MCEKNMICMDSKNNVNGGMAEYMKFPKESLNYKVPKDLPIEKKRF